MSIHSLENDQWFVKQVNDGRITVTEAGTVTNNRTGRTVGCPNSNGYLHIGLSDKGKSRAMYIHRLVFLIHQGPIPKGFVINHIDGDKTNNRISNLEMVTPSDNIRHAYATKLIPQDARKGENSGNSLFTNKQVKRLRDRYRAGLITIDQIVDLFCVSRGSVFNMLTGRSYQEVSGSVGDQRQKVTPELLNKAIRMKKDGKGSWDTIGKVLGVSGESLRRNFWKLNSLSTES